MPDDRRDSPAPESASEAGSEPAASPDAHTFDESAGQSESSPVESSAETPESSDAATDSAEDTRPAGVSEGGRSARHRNRRAARKNRKAPWWEFPLLIIAALLVAVLIKSFVAQPFYIPSQSMEKTLHGCPGCNDDKILVNKLVYDVRDPHPGDIVVFKAPPGWDDGPRPTVPSNPIAKGVRKLAQLIGVVPPDDYVLVKRVIAVGGQTVKGDAQGDVYISDHGTAGPWRKLDEPFVYRDGPVESTAKFGPVTVPKDRLWVMGDHRNASADSRYHCDADGTPTGSAQPTCDPVESTVPVSDVIGKAVWIIWPVSRWNTLGTPSTFNAAAPPLGGALFVLPLAVLLRRRRSRR